MLYYYQQIYPGRYSIYVFLPNQEANPTPQAPISDLNVQQENQTTTVDTTGAAAEPTSTPGVAMLAGIGGVIAVAIGAAVWYLKRGRS